MVVTRLSATKSLAFDGTHISEAKGQKAGKDKKKTGSTSSSPFNYLLADDSSPCKICKVNVGDDKGIKCDRCTAWVHLKCSELDSSEYTQLAKIQSVSVKWHCPVCSAEMSKLADPNDRLASNEAKLDHMMTIVTMLQQQNAMILNLLVKSEDKMEETVQKHVRETYEEDRDREARRNNLIMYNLKESRGTGEEAEKEDNLKVFNVIHDIDSNLAFADVEANVVEIVRLGKKQDKKVRPVKVVLKSNDMKARILRKAKNLKKSESFSTVGVSADKTMMERNRDKLLVEERNKRRENNEDVVIYRGKVVLRESIEADKPEAAGNASGNQ